MLAPNDNAIEQLDHLTSSLAIQPSDPPALPTSSANGVCSNPRRSDGSSNEYLIPESDPCYPNLGLRNRAVDLLQLVTARTTLRFVLSLLEGEDRTQLGLAQTATRDSIIRSVEKNQDSLARHSRSETQLIIGQYLLSTREEIVQHFDEGFQPSQSDHSDEDVQSDPIQSLEAELDERKVSRLVEDKISDLISTQFKTYSHDIDELNSNTPQPASTVVQFSPIDLAQVSTLMSFYGKVFYWNKLFDLILTSSSQP